ncbi:hypothetical protein M413DRAFT_28139 [Hebeloma cylindrosporum]|uniref:Uncharacterized protein n=1 Tax=Hebeloma cylindrosporum TaxID=76867 RepID=A0A0C3C9Z3_HEBCY|nr:hypothetical protein M413DRAFT_28139 [Hebeloma cylindrosporum h7]
MIDDGLLERISSENSELLCSRLEEFICESPVASAVGIVQFIKRKQDGNIPKLARLKKVALVSDIRWGLREEMGELLPELRPYISQGLIFHISELDTSGTAGYRYLADRVVYGNSAAYRSADGWGL